MEIFDKKSEGIVVLSLFDGLSCGMIALERAGIKVAKYFASEVDKHAIKVSKHNYPSIIHIGDVTKVSYKGGILYTDAGSYDIPKIDLVIGGSPCFVKGTSILTLEGYKSIEDVVPGDCVLTHTNTFKKVLRVGSDADKSTMLLKAQGILPTTTTSNHPYYVRTKKDSPTWKAAGDLRKGDFIGVPVNNIEENPLGLTEDECLVLGRYIADGHTRKDFKASEGRPDDRHWQLIISVGDDKKEEFESKYKIKHSFYKHTQSTYRAVFSNKRLVEIAEKYCGIGSHNKVIPQILMNLPKHLCLKVFEGYADGDGCTTKNGWQATTVSKDLALSLSHIIAKVYNKGSSVSYFERPRTCVIQGRVVNQSDTYLVRLHHTSKPRWFVENGVVWYPFKSIEETGEKERVFNMEVECDNSYTANNAIVHNCQSISNLGDGSGLEGKSSLFFHFLRIKKEVEESDSNNSLKFLLENVVGNKKSIQVISDLMGVNPVLFNSGLVSAQTRARYYWTNISFNLPEDMQVKLKDILEPGTPDDSILTHGRANWVKSESGKKCFEKRYAVLDPEKANCLTARSDASWNSNYVTRDGQITRLTPVEYERLQTVPDNHTSCVRRSERYKMLGNGWTVDVIAHIFKSLVDIDK